MNFKQGAFSARNIATLGVLTALVFVFQFAIAPLIQMTGTSPALVLVPIVLGGLLIGTWAGAFLGFLFSTIVFLCGLFGLDPSTQLMIQTNWFVSFLIIYLKGTLAGLVPGLVFKLLKNRNQYLAVFLASISAPIVNTAIYLVGMLLTSNIFFASYNSFVETVFQSIILINFTIELIISIIANPAVYTVVKNLEKRKER